MDSDDIQFVKAEQVLVRFDRTDAEFVPRKVESPWAALMRWT